MPEIKLMAHMLAGYPDLESSATVARALVKGGADALEVQFPFSDPSADGPAIESASQAALDAGFRVEDGFKLVARLREELGVPLFIMTYGSLVFARGAGAFAKRAAMSGARGLIIPDLPPDYSEGIFEAGRFEGVAVIPVIAPEISAARLKMIGDLRPEYIYTALRLGITGSRTELDEATIRYLDKVSGLGAEIIAGFGVRTREQMLALSNHAQYAAVGSFFVEKLAGTGKGQEKIAATLTAAAQELTQVRQS